MNVPWSPSSSAAPASALSTQCAGKIVRTPRLLDVRVGEAEHRSVAAPALERPAGRPERRLRVRSAAARLPETLAALDRDLAGAPVPRRAARTSPRAADASQRDGHLRGQVERRCQAQVVSAPEAA